MDCPSCTLEERYALLGQPLPSAPYQSPGENTGTCVSPTAMSNSTTHYCPFTHLEHKDSENQLEQGTDLPCGLYLIPLIGHKVCPPHADRLWYCASSWLTAGPCQGAMSSWSLPVNEEDVNRNLPPEQMNDFYYLKQTQILLHAATRSLGKKMWCIYQWFKMVLVTCTRKTHLERECWNHIAPDNLLLLVGWQ